MLADWMQKLLILQDRDARRETLERQLKDAPTEIASIQATMREDDQRLQDAAAAIQKLEASRRLLETEVESVQAAIYRYKNQQLQVKKNEEYTALEHEIAAASEKIAAIEDNQLELLVEIEAKEAALTQLRADVDHAHKLAQFKIDQLNATHADAEANYADAVAAQTACEGAVEPAFLQQYKYVRTQVKRLPIVVAIEDGRCMGCRLKVSGEVASNAMRGTEIIRCDSCGRILYHESNV